MRIWFPDWAYLDLDFSIAYNSISIIHYSKLMSLTSRMVARICSHFQLSSSITHQNEWRVSEKEKKKIYIYIYDGVPRVIEIEWLLHFCNSTQQLEPTVSVLSHHCQPLYLPSPPLNGSLNPYQTSPSFMFPPFILFPTLFPSRPLLLSIPTGTSCLSSQSATPTEQRYGFFLRLSIELRQWSWTYRYTRG